LADSDTQFYIKKELGLILMNIIHATDFFDPDFGFAYRFLNKQGLLLEEHSHDYFEYFFVASGNVWHCVNGEKEMLSKGDLIFIRPDDYHGYVIDPDMQFELINISFTINELDRFCNYVGENLNQTLCSLKNPPKIKQDDEQLTLEADGVVQAFHRQAIDHRRVAHDCDDVVLLAGDCVSLGEPDGGADGSARMADVKEVVRRLGRRGEAADRVLLAQGREVLGPPGEKLMRVALVPNIEELAVAEGLGPDAVNVVQSEG
jgi:hypothetical protein